MNANMTIHIPSRGRAEKQVTIQQLPARWRERTTIWVYPEEYSNYKSNVKGIRIFKRPKHLKGLSPLRQWLLENVTEPYMVILDDDLRFSKRTTENKLVLCEPIDVHSMLKMLGEWSESGIALGSISSRFLLNNKPRGYEDNKRTNGVTAINVKLVRDVIKARYDRVPLAGDADLTLQVLLAGYKTRVSTEYAYGQMAGSKGGASTYRTIKMMDDVYHKLVEMHPGIVSLFQHKTKHKFQGEANVRTDIRVAWKKAASIGFLRRRAK